MRQIHAAFNMEMERARIARDADIDAARRIFKPGALRDNAINDIWKTSYGIEVEILKTFYGPDSDHKKGKS